MRHMKGSDGKRISLLTKHLTDQGHGDLLKVDTFLSILTNSDFNPMISSTRLPIISVTVVINHIQITKYNILMLIKIETSRLYA